MVAEKKKKRDTSYYDDFAKLYIKMRDIDIGIASQVRNILWEQIKNLLYSRVRDIIDRRKGDIIRQDPDFAKQLYQDCFLILQKACDIWDPKRGTKFLTFLGDITDQEIRNKIRLHFYHKTRDKKIRLRTIDELEPRVTTIEEHEKEEMLEEVKRLFENYAFKSKLERDIVNLVVYGREGEWKKLQKKSKMSIENFYALRDKILKELKTYILENCTITMKDSLENLLGTEIKE
jgi:hypothetical protein